MSKGKLKKFEELGRMPNVVQNFDFHDPQLIDHQGERLDCKGRWSSDFFGNSHPLTLELACGKGEYSTGLAKLFPNNNYIGVDLKGNRIWNAAKRAQREKLDNVAFLRSKIELIPHYFAKGEVNEIWIIFPDPFARRGSHNRRLTSPYFIEQYRKICAPDALIHLKTDDPTLWEYSLEIMVQENCKVEEVNENIYKQGEPGGALSIKTYYEGLHLEAGKTIRHLAFRL